MIAGYSSGSFMSAQMVVAYPEVFRGACFLNGGLPVTGEKFSDYFAASMMPEGRERNDMEDRLYEEITTKI